MLRSFKMGLDIYIESRRKEGDELAYWRKRFDILDVIVSLYPDFENGDTVGLLIEDVLAMQALLTLKMVDEDYEDNDWYPDDMTEMAEVVRYMVVHKHKRVWFHANW